MIREFQKFVYPFFLKIRHPVISTISGKHNDAGIRAPRFDVRNDGLDFVAGEARVRCNYQIKLSPCCVIGAIGILKCYIVAMFPKYSSKSGSELLLFCDEENVVYCPTSFY